MAHAHRLVGYICLSQLCMAASVYATAPALELPPPLSEIEQSDESKLKSPVFSDSVMSPGHHVQTTSPKLNFLVLDGYFRLRANYFNRCDLNTFVPADPDTSRAPMWTSNCPPPIGYFSPQAPDQNNPSVVPDRPDNLFSTNMRLRVDPTLNVSENIRIHTTVDVFDNLVLGSTPYYFAGPGINPSYPLSFLSFSQNPPLVAINNPYGSVLFKRVWGDISTPIGDFRFGRMPLNFGLGILMNSGDDLDSDGGTAIDGIVFSTTVLGMQFSPGYAIAFSGPTGWGLPASPPAEMVQQLNLDPSAGVHTFFFTLTQKDSPLELQEKLSAGALVYNYGVFAAYRMQLSDVKYRGKDERITLPYGKESNQYELIDRNSHTGMLSFWSSFLWEKLEVSAELVGILGWVGGTSDLLWDKGVTPQNLWLIQGGLALKSRYKLFNDRLEFGLDGGWASGDSAPQWGIRPNNQLPRLAGEDGQQFGKGQDNNITNFNFSPDFHIDLLLFRQVLGTITDAYYVRPHVGYWLTDSFSVSGDIIGSLSNFASSTPGNSNLLGVEFDLYATYKHESGVFVRLAGGYLVPLKGLNQPDSLQNQSADLYTRFGTARTAATVQLFAGIVF